MLEFNIGFINNKQRGHEIEKKERKKRGNKYIAISF